MNTDVMITGLRSFGGFYKRFKKQNSESFSVVTKPFNIPAFAKSLAKQKDLTGHGKIIHLEYEDVPFNQVYDILKMAGENKILGKAFLGKFERGQLLFDFNGPRHITLILWVRMILQPYFTMMSIVIPIQKMR